MNTQSTVRLLPFLFFFAGFFTLQAQDPNPTKIVLIQKIVHDDGTETVIKKSISSEEELEEVLPEFKKENAEYFAIQITEGKECDFEFKMNEHEHNFILKGDNMQFYGMHHPEKKAFLGVYPTHNPDGEGVLLNGVIANTGASAAGLLNGDVLLSIDEHELPTNSSLGKVLYLYQPDEEIQITFLRNGQTMTTTAVLGNKSDTAYRNLKRDPCQVFIGVSVGSQGPDGLGTQVSGIIPNTPAEAVGLLAGDIILALDDAETNSHETLLYERNKHQPGEWFTLSILRNGQVMDVDAQFKTCKENTPVAPAETPPPAKEPEPEDPIQNINPALDLLDYSAYPNPTYGDLNISFKAEAKPTKIRITDVTGRVVFEENRPDFDGYFARPIDLQHAQPGLLMLTIQQEDKFVMKKIVLLARA